MFVQLYTKVTIYTDDMFVQLANNMSAVLRTPPAPLANYYFAVPRVTVLA